MQQPILCIFAFGFRNLKHTIKTTDIQTLHAILLYIIDKMSGSQKCDVYHIVKAVFFAQEFHLVRYLQPLYDDKIVALPYGPVPSAAYDVLRFARGDASVINYHAHDGLQDAASGILFDAETFSASVRPDMDCLSPSRIECLNDAIDKVLQMSFNEIRDTTHQHEWERASHTPQKEMDLLAIAKEGGADDAAIEYLRESLEFDRAFA